MSRVVNNAKPIATALILARPIELGPDEISKLSAWIGLTTVMQEFSNSSGKQMIPAEERLQLMSGGTALPQWTILIGRYSGQNWSPMNHVCIPVTYSKDDLDSEPTFTHHPRNHIQLLTFTLRNVIVHVFTATEPGLISAYRQYIDKYAGLSQIWPSTHECLAWPFTTAIADSDVDSIAYDWTRSRFGLDMRQLGWRESAALSNPGDGELAGWFPLSPRRDN